MLARLFVAVIVVEKEKKRKDRHAAMRMVAKRHAITNKRDKRVLLFVLILLPGKQSKLCKENFNRIILSPSTKLIES